MKKVKERQAKNKKPVDTYVRPQDFDKFVSVIEYAKKAVYSITRIREVSGETFVVTLGTGFLIGENKMMTCCHVIESIEPNSQPLARHQNGDVYYLLNKDEFDKDHYYRLTGRLNKNLYLYPDQDVAVITLSEDFYVIGNKILQNRDVYLRPSTKAYPLGSSAAVLGFPEEVDDVKKVAGLYLDKKTNVLRDELIKKRVDRGVINARYTDPKDNVIKYDFTMAFNPGNSGGPIIDNDCNVIAIARGYRAFPIRVIEENYTRNKPDGSTENLSQLATIRAIYSIGYSLESCQKILEDHRIQVS